MHTYIIIGLSAAVLNIIVGLVVKALPSIENIWYALGVIFGEIVIILLWPVWFIACILAFTSYIMRDRSVGQRVDTYEGILDVSSRVINKSIRDLLRPEL